MLLSQGVPSVLHGDGGRGESSFTHGTVDVECLGGATRALLGRSTLAALTIFRPPLAAEGERVGVDTR